MKNYDIVVHREGRWWMIAIPSIEGLTQARRLFDVERMAVSYISVDQDVRPAEVEITWAKLLVDGADVERRREALEELRRKASELDAQIREEQVSLARELKDDGVPLRDVGQVLGVSHQRVSQLLDA